MKIQELEHKKILILGYGKEGRSTEAYLRAHLPGAVIDHADRSTDEHYLERQQGYDLVIKTPGIPKSLVTVPYTTATNLFFANCKNKIIGVTGTKGKSTTSSLIFHILRSAGYGAHLVGNIGNPALSEIHPGLGAEDIFVMELSSYQLDDIAHSPQISVVLNLFPEHMNYHGDTHSYYLAKKNILAYSTAQDYFVYNPKYELLSQWANETRANPLPFGEGDIVPEGATLIGEHNAQNMQAAIAVSKIFGISRSIVDNAIKSFKPLPHRLEKVGIFDGIVFYDDAISTTPQSTVAALQALKDVDTLFLGGEDRGYDFTLLAETAGNLRIPNIVLFPDSGENIYKAIREIHTYSPAILQTRSMEEAVNFAFAKTRKGCVCLLSTASPSYSVWKNFEEKGDLFKLFVKNHDKNKADIRQ